MKTLSLIAMTVISSASAGLPCIDLHTVANRKEYVTDTYFTWNSTFKPPETMAEFSKDFLMVVGKDFSISFDLHTGITTIKGQYHPDKAAQEFLRCLKSACEQDRQREQHEYEAKAKLKLIDQLEQKLK